MDGWPGRARRGRLATPHGVIETPAFIFCATKAAMKAATVDQVKAAGSQIILSNTYHLMLQPGAELVARMGGLHRFTGWDGPMLTDSGGYQVFAMGHGSVAQEIKGNRQAPRDRSLLKITEEGAVFRSYIDGAVIALTPERSIEIQHRLGADLIVVFDECTAYHDDRDYTARSMQLSHRWADRCIAAFDRLGGPATQRLYGVIQGGIYDDLRREAVEFALSRDLFGIAVGGCLGGTKAEMTEVVGHAMRGLADSARPVHLLGIGGVADIWQGIARGVDTFDCVAPTRVARHGAALIRPARAEAEGLRPGQGHLNLRNARYRDDPQPLDAESDCPISQRYSRAYIHHLLKADEILAQTLLTAHNIAYMNRLMRDVRGAIEHDRVAEEAARWLGVPMDAAAA
ncbi:MAG: tRNA guanosine(34) transglycosylase Tgt [Alphaproteobacteria bacterium]